MKENKEGSSQIGVESQNQAKNPIKVKKPVGKTVLIVFLGLFLLLLISYAALTLASSGKSLPRLNLVGINVGSKTKAEIFMAVKKVAEQRKDQKVTINFEDSKETKTFNDLGLDLNINQTVEKIYNFGKIKGIFPSPQYIFSTASGTLKVQPLTSWNANATKQISEMVIGKKQDAQNPKLSYADSEVKIEKEKNGFTYNIQTLSDDLEICYLKASCDQITGKKVALRSNITQSDLEHFKDQFNEVANLKLTLNYDSKTVHPTGEDLVSFIDAERVVLEQKMAYNDQTIDDYLSDISGRINKKGKNKVISTLDNSVIDEGQEGIALDIKSSREAIKKALNDKQTFVELTASTTPIEEEFVGPGFTPGKYPGKFIEINLSDQMLYLMEGTNNVGSFKVSTGKWSMPTPIGEYSVNNKDPRAYSQEYGLYMPFWMSFIGSQYGIHELPEWPDGTKEGEGHLGIPVSHGCVRLGRGAAETVYGWTDVGTPVYIHE